MIGNRWTALSFLKSFEQVDRRIISERKSQNSLTLWRKLEKRSDKNVLNHDPMHFGGNIKTKGVEAYTLTN
jgi:hypothetical protein